MTPKFPPSNEKAYTREKITIYFTLARFVKINLETCLLINNILTDTYKQLPKRNQKQKRTRNL